MRSRLSCLDAFRGRPRDSEQGIARSRRAALRHRPVPALCRTRGWLFGSRCAPELQRNRFAQGPAASPRKHLALRSASTCQVQLRRTPAGEPVGETSEVRPLMSCARRTIAGRRCRSHRQTTRSACCILAWKAGRHRRGAWYGSQELFTAGSGRREAPEPQPQQVTVNAGRSGRLLSKPEPHLFDRRVAVPAMVWRQAFHQSGRAIRQCRYYEAQRGRSRISQTSHATERIVARKH